MDAVESPGRRLLGMFVTISSIASLVGFALAAWISVAELANRQQSPSSRWVGLAMSLCFAIGFALGPVMSWVEYRRQRSGRAVGWAAAPYVVLAVICLGVRLWVH